MLESLPERPLTNSEAEQLKNQGKGVVPISILKGKDDPYVIYTLAIYRNAASKVHLLGYSDQESGWVGIKSFPEDEWTVEKQENTIQQWIDEQYSDEFKQGQLNEETNQIEML